MYEQQM